MCPEINTKIIHFQPAVEITLANSVCMRVFSRELARRVQAEMHSVMKFYSSVSVIRFKPLRILVAE